MLSADLLEPSPGPEVGRQSLSACKGGLPLGYEALKKVALVTQVRPKIKAVKEPEN